MLRNRENEVLFIDARTLGDGGNNDDGYTLLTEEDKERIANTVFAWRSPDKDTLYHDIPEFCYSATNDEIERNSFNLAPSKYIEFIDRDFEIDYESEMTSIQVAMQRLMKEETDLQQALKEAFKGIGYAID